MSGTVNGSVRGVARKLVVVLTSLALACGLLVAGTAPSAQAWDGGNTAPTKTISGGNTGLNQPFSMAFDSSGDIYVSNYNGNSVTVYGSTATGDAAPIRTISGGSSGISQPAGVALDGDDNIYVTNAADNSVRVFDAGATGGVAPVQTISGGNTGISAPAGLAVDEDNNIYVTNAVNNSVRVFASGADGDVAPVRTISGGNTGLGQPMGVVLDGEGNIYVTNRANNSVTVFEPGATGDVAPDRTISGAATGLNFPVGVALDGDDNIYVANQLGDSVRMFASDATGNATPTKVLSGMDTGLSTSNGVAVASNGDMYVSNMNSNSLTMYAGVSAPSAPTISSITPGDKQLSVAFTAGADGGSPITNYQYSTDNGVTWQARNPVATTSPIVITKLSTNGTTDLVNGTTYQVRLRAVNSIGNGAASAAVAATPKGPQTITFDPLADKSIDESPVTVSATASSGLPVSFSSTTTDVCTVSGTSVTLLTTGTCTIQANQAGNAAYNAATPVTRSFVVTSSGGGGGGGGATPAAPTGLKKVGNPKPTASKFKFTWKKSTHATSKTVYVMQLWFRGQKKPFLIKSTKKLAKTLTRKQILSAWKKSLRTQARGETGGIVKFTVKLRARTGTKVSKPTTTTLRVKV